MADIGQAERNTQNHVIHLFTEQLGYTYLGNWEERDNNSNIEEAQLRKYLHGTGKYSEDIISKAIKALQKEARINSHDDLYTANKEVYAMLRYGTAKKAEAQNKPERVRSLKVDNKIVRYLSEEEKPRLLKASKAIGGKFYLKVLMALTTGMRKGELDKLRWNNIDFEKGLALLSDTKNGSPRHTPIPGVIINEMKKYREVGNGLLFQCPGQAHINVRLKRSPFP